MQDGAEKDDDWVASADCVFCFVEVAEETFEVVLLDQLHSLVVQLADKFMDRHVFLVRLVIEIIAPVAEITGDDKDSVLVIEVFR